MRIRPADPKVPVIDPTTKRAIAADGQDVEPSSYWHRRLSAGEVVRVEVASPALSAPVTPLTTR